MTRRARSPSAWARPTLTSSYKLALLLAAPAPPGAAGHLMDRAPFLPGTGPYMISRYRPDSSLTLVRNPRFRQWSYAAQPAGYPDVIRFEQMADPRQQESAVAAGRADVVDISLERPAVPPSGHPVPDQGPLQPQAFHHVPVPQHPPAAVHQPQGPAGPQLRHRPRPDHPAPRLRLPRPGRPDMPDPAGRFPQLPALLPLHGRRHRTAPGTAPTWPRRCGSLTSPAPRRCR